MSSQQPNRQQKSSQQSNSAIVATIAAVGLGAVAAVGAYFMGKSVGEEETARKNAAHRASIGAPPHRTLSDDDEVSKGKRGEDEQDGHGDECSLCLRKYEEVKELNEEIHTTPCGHVYCERCITRWLDIKQECPRCKRRVCPGQTLRIYL